MQNLSRLILVSLFFYTLNVDAQISNAEGIDPMEGVVIPKRQKEQMPQDKFEPPYYLQKYPPSYPALSMRFGEEGVVMVMVLIGSDGVPQQVELQTSSGFDRLDQSALNTVMRWRFYAGQERWCG
jgi:TonB family protein